MALRTRSRASRTEALGKPTISKLGRPLDTSTCTSTRTASTPRTAQEKIVASTLYLHSLQEFCEERYRWYCVLFLRVCRYPLCSGRNFTRLHQHSAEIEGHSEQQVLLGEFKSGGQMLNARCARSVPCHRDDVKTARHPVKAVALEVGLGQGSEPPPLARVDAL